MGRGSDRPVHHPERRQRPVSRRATPPLLAAFAYSCTALLGGCTSNKEAAPPFDVRSALRAVSLPDLSAIEPSVHDQLRGGYASLTAKLEAATSTPAELGAAYGEMGRLFMAAEYYDAAEPCFLNAHALVPTELRWPYYLAHVYRARHDPEKAVAFFEKSAAMDPNNEAVLVWLGSTYLDLNRPAEAEPRFLRVLSVRPQSTPALYGAGRAALAQRDYARAIERLERALSFDQRPSGIQYQLAMAYRGAGEPQRAEVYVRQHGPIEIQPADPLMDEIGGLLDSAVADEARGTRALQDGDWNAAAAYFRKASALAPPGLEPALRHKLGTALFLAGDVRGAVEQFEQALRMSPTFAKARFSLGVAMGTSGRLQEAIEQLSAAVKHDPTYIEARLRLAEVLQQAGRVPEALLQYEQVMTIDSRVAEAPLEYALALVRLERYGEARKRLNEGMKAYPDRPEFADALAQLEQSPKR
jgi:tetratricopeptide (TPR) repeat protein